MKMISHSSPSLALVILTDEEGNPLGLVERREAHAGEGILHKAFSVYVFCHRGAELLIQKRSNNKLFAGLWANTCCSHPSTRFARSGQVPSASWEMEDIVEAGKRRLREELGFTCPLEAIGTFVYRAEDSEGRGVEHEHVTVCVGEVGEKVEPQPDPQEIADWRWVDVEELKRDMEEHPTKYAPWFHKGFALLLKKKHVSV